MYLHVYQQGRVETVGAAGISFRAASRFFADLILTLAAEFFLKDVIDLTTFVCGTPQTGEEGYHGGLKLP